MATYYRTSKDFELSEISAGEWEALKYVGYDAKNLEIPAEIDGKKITRIGANFFKGNTNIKNIKIANGIKSIGSSAFESCKNLKSVILPESLESIEDSVFSGSGIKELHLPNSVKEIGDDLCMGCKELNKVVLSDSLTEIPGWAFSHCPRLKFVILPKKIKVIKSNAFTECQMKYIDLPEGLEIIETDAFYQSSLRKIILPQSIKSIGTNSINGGSLRTVIILPGCEAHLGEGIFGKDAYWYGDALTSVCIPASVTEIDNVFHGESSSGYTRTKRDEDGRIVRDAWGNEVTERVDTTKGGVYVSEKLTVYCESGSEIMSLARSNNIKCSDYSTYLSAHLDTVRIEIKIYVGIAIITDRAKKLINDLINSAPNTVKGFLNKLKNK